MARSRVLAFWLLSDTMLNLLQALVFLSVELTDSVLRIIQFWGTFRTTKTPILFGITEIYLPAIYFDVHLRCP